MVKFAKTTEEAPCKQACPIGIDIPKYIRLIADRKYDEAFAVICEKNPFPSVCSHVCLRPCESQCNLSKMLFGPIAINALKRFVAEQASRKRVKETPIVNSFSGKRVAIVGSGPTGLTTAYYLAKLGHTVTVFEALAKPGGMMQVGIPEYRLPRDVPDMEIDIIKKTGVEIRTNTRVESLDELLKQGYDAVLLAVGAHQGERLPIPGADLKGVLVGTSFLRDVSLGQEVRVGETVVVLGGGDVAFDCARTALRLGAGDAHIACLEPKDGMLATAGEIEQGEEEGITIHPSHTFTRIVSGNGRITGVECLDVSSFEFDDEGKVHVDSIAGSEHILPADTVIFAIGQLPELELIEGVSGIKTTRLHTLDVDSATLATGKEGVFATGDAVTGTTSVIEAIAGGRRAAASIDKYLGGDGIIDEKLAPTEEKAAALTLGLPVDFRPVLPVLPAEERIKTFAEVELSLPEATVTEEAKRCLRCDLPIIVDGTKCTVCLVCQMLCALRFTGNSFDLARAAIKLRRTESGTCEIEFTDECDHCALCARYCSYGALTLGRKGGVPLITGG